MKRGIFLTIFISTHITFVVLQIHKHSQFIKQSYRKQKNEQLRNKLLQEKQSLVHQWYALHNQDQIKEYAQKKLGMIAINLQQIKKLDHDQQ
jgi:hypothetical protein